MMDDDEEKKFVFPSITLKFNKFNGISNVFRIIGHFNKLANSDEGLSIPRVVLWENEVESEQSVSVDLAFGLNSYILVLNSFNNSNASFSKIQKYLENLSEYYN